MGIANVISAEFSISSCNAQYVNWDNACCAKSYCWQTRSLTDRTKPRFNNNGTINFWAMTTILQYDSVIYGKECFSLHIQINVISVVIKASNCSSIH